MIHVGDCRDVLPTLEAGSVHCVVTSPPYWGLRDYGVTGQLGLEPTPEEYVANMVAVFREVRRVLRDDGTVWLNLGDSYNNRTKVRTSSHQPALNGFTDDVWAERAARGGVRMSLGGDIKEKDLVGIPWRVAFALQADGWYLRSDIIWSKPNPMPESVTDRPTKSHEYVFLLSKRERYFFDADAVREPSITPQQYGQAAMVASGTRRSMDATLRHHGGETDWQAGRNIRSVWNIATQPYPGAHFATFPEALVVPCIKAGTSERGVCAECGAPWERVVERERVVLTGSGGPSLANGHGPDGRTDARANLNVTTLGWRPTCAHVRCPVCHNTGDANTVGNMPRVRPDVRPEGSSSTGEVLFSGVRVPSRSEDATDDAGLRGEPEGLHPPLPTDAPDGDEDGLRGRASFGDVRGPWAEPGAVGSGGPHQRREGRQPAREPAGDDEEGTRRPIEPRASEDGDVPRLRASLPSPGTCGQCGADLEPLEPIPAVVLDCFGGSGTVGEVAERLSRRAVLIELSPTYAELARERTAQVGLGLTA